MKVTRRQAALATAAGAVVADGPTGFVGRLAATPRMLRDVLLGRWNGIGRGKVALMGLALVYLVSPIDLLPEAVLTIPGLADDALVAAWLVSALLAATGSYRTWEAAGSPPPGPEGIAFHDAAAATDGPAPRVAHLVVPGEVVRPHAR